MGISLDYPVVTNLILAIALYWLLLLHFISGLSPDEFIWQ